MSEGYDYEKELTSSSLSSTSENCGHTLKPKPPQKPRSGSSNLYSRQRIYKTYSELNTNRRSFDRHDSIDSNIHPNDEIIKIMNTTPTNVSRLSKYSALPKISKQLSNRSVNSPTSRPSSINSNLEFDYNNLYDEIDDADTLIGLRLPDGSKKQKSFLGSTKLQAVLDYGLNEMELDKNNYTLLQLPNNIIENLDLTLSQANIRNRSMFFVIDKTSL